MIYCPRCEVPRGDIREYYSHIWWAHSHYYWNGDADSCPFCGKMIKRDCDAADCPSSLQRHLNDCTKHKLARMTGRRVP